ncbi:hypothetical protein T484DRAFT_1845638 [Baffinella frigidus]|nr:hypothetical protein T484DRAFT_1845638 [Cryptophyta sp. CCMP2293]
MSSMKIDPAWLEDGREKATCPVCIMVMERPTAGCPDGHALCLNCYATELSYRKKCPLCQHPTEESFLQRCIPLEEFIGDLRMRCAHGPEGANLAPLGERWCSWRGKVCDFQSHLAVCGREEVQCPCPGCEERMARAEVEGHVAASGAVHLQRACRWAAEMEEKVADQNSVISGLQRNVQALNRVFTSRHGLDGLRTRGGVHLHHALSGGDLQGG